jgi:hypothetical protein
MKLRALLLVLMSISVGVALAKMIVRDAPAGLSRLPFSNKNPVILTNDAGTHDVHQAELAFALSSRGDLHLLGFVAEKVWRGAQFDDFENDAYPDLAAMAGRSGLVRLPPIYQGFREGNVWTLVEPKSGQVDNTEPIETDGARFIKEAVLKAEVESPVVVIAGGQVTSIASAYLMAAREGKGETFAQRVIVIADFGEFHTGEAVLNGFNLYVDPWAAYVVLKRLATALVSWQEKTLGTVNRFEMLRSMPASELSRFMYDKDLTNEWLPGNIVGDSMGLVLLFYPGKGTYFNSVTRAAVKDKWKTIEKQPWFPSGRTDAPVITEDGRGNIIVVGELDPKYETNLFADVLLDPLTYQGKIIQQSPYYGRPANLAGVIEAEHFDRGQEGVAYHDEAFSELRPLSASRFRMLERPDVAADAHGNVFLAYIGNDEWEEYTVEVPASGEWSGSVRVSSQQTALFHLEFRHIKTDAVICKTQPLQVPNTGGLDHWIDLEVPSFILEAGTYVMRFVNDTRIPRWEAEDLQFRSNVAVRKIDSPQFSGGMAHLIESDSKGDFIEYRATIDKDTRRLILGYKAGGDQAYVMLRINDRLHVNRAERPFVIDQFVWKPEWRTFEFGSIRLEASDELRLRFEAVSKNLLSSGWKMIIDYIEFQTEGPYRVDHFRFEPPLPSAGPQKTETVQPSLTGKNG